MVHLVIQLLMRESSNSHETAPHKEKNARGLVDAYLARSQSRAGVYLYQQAVNNNDLKQQ